jgi:hypothetical protein
MYSPTEPKPLCATPSPRVIKKPQARIPCSGTG